MSLETWWGWESMRKAFQAHPLPQQGIMEVSLRMPKPLFTSARSCPGPQAPGRETRSAWCAATARDGGTEALEWHRGALGLRGPQGWHRRILHPLCAGRGLPSGSEGFLQTPVPPAGHPQWPTLLSLTVGKSSHEHWAMLEESCFVFLFVCFSVFEDQVF